jgi:hypothetical protein
MQLTAPLNASNILKPNIETDQSNFMSIEQDQTNR